LKELLAATLVLALLSPALAADEDVHVSRAGTRTVATAPAQNFTGAVKVEILHTPSGAQRAAAGSVSFAPGARTAWHSHPLGQTLIVTAGVGRVQRWGGPVAKIRAGDVVHIAPGVKCGRVPGCRRATAAS
jgi:4-carboxymuconolactone decarboxylase